MPGLLSQNGLAKRETALTGFETGGNSGLLGRAGFQTSPNLADPGIANNLRQSAIEASQAPLASVSQAAPAAPRAKVDSSGGSGQETAEPAPPNTGNISATQGVINALGFTNPIGAVVGLVQAVRNKTDLSVTGAISEVVDQITGFISDVFGPDVDDAGPGQGSEGTGAAGPGAGNDAPGASAGAGGDPGVDSAESGNDGPDGDGEGDGPGGGCFPAGTPIDMGDGSTKPVELVGIGDLTRGGIVTATMQFMAQKQMFEYRGVTVSGCHAIRDKGVWKRVADVGDAKLLDDERLRTINRVYVFDTTEHRIHVGGVTFADYSEVDEDSAAWSAADDALLDGLKAQDEARGVPERRASRESIHWTGAR